MSSTDRHIPDSDASEASEVDHVHTPEPEETKESSPPRSTLSHRFRESPQKSPEDRKRDKNSDDSIAVLVPPPARPWEYQAYKGDTTVDSVIEKKTVDEMDIYTVEYEDGRKEAVSIMSFHF